jgi:hypothetical protein
MNSIVVQKEHIAADYRRGSCPTLEFLVLLIWCSAVAFGQNTSLPTNSPFNIRATHLMGFEGTKGKTKGMLSIQGTGLQFQNGGSATHVDIASVQDVILGEQSQQVGGVPMTLGKAAAPFGGGRVVSLFAHKKYDIVTLEYVDTNGGFHGAIFQLNKGQGEAFRNELLARGAHLSHHEGATTKDNTAEVQSESK